MLAAGRLIAQRLSYAAVRRAVLLGGLLIATSSLQFCSHKERRAVDHRPLAKLFGRLATRVRERLKLEGVKARLQLLDVLEMLCDDALHLLHVVRIALVHR